MRGHVEPSKLDPSEHEAIRDARRNNWADDFANLAKDRHPHPDADLAAEVAPDAGD